MRLKNTIVIIIMWRQKDSGHHTPLLFLYIVMEISPRLRKKGNTHTLYTVLKFHSTKVTQGNTQGNTHSAMWLKLSSNFPQSLNLNFLKKCGLLLKVSVNFYVDRQICVPDFCTFPPIWGPQIGGWKSKPTKLFWIYVDKCTVRLQFVLGDFMQYFPPFSLPTSELCEPVNFSF